jgi:hypothetical protein
MVVGGWAAQPRTRAGVPAGFSGLAAIVARPCRESREKYFRGLRNPGVYLTTRRDAYVQMYCWMLYMGHTNILASVQDLAVSG